MKLATFTHAGSTRIGVVRGEELVDLSAAAPDLPRDLIAFLAQGQRARQRAGEAAAASSARAAARRREARGADPAPAEVPRRRPELRRPRRRERPWSGPKFPTIFNKQSTCVIGPDDEIHLPRVSTALDYEGELAFVIGKRCRHVPRRRAPEVIAGYCVANDVSVRDWQLRVPTWTMGKSFDTHGPLGPWLTTADEAGDPHGARHPHARERRAAPELEHQGADLRLLRAGRAPRRPRSRSRSAT